ncbi:TrbC/VirB2 family protein [Xenorhabdus entomophaga]|uniref:TrbC/VirB2 family protein n=1 Tax=Xenorhabdus entomophaga TaxID=3136257 RepID=UPI0030F447AB
MKIKKWLNNKLLTMFAFLFATPAFANGFSAAEGLLEKVKAGLSGLAVVTVTIAVFWVGYKVLFGGSTLRECAPIIIGGIVIASAAEVASMMVG